MPKKRPELSSVMSNGLSLVNGSTPFMFTSSPVEERYERITEGREETSKFELYHEFKSSNKDSIDSDNKECLDQITERIKQLKCATLGSSFETKGEKSKKSGKRKKKL